MITLFSGEDLDLKYDARGGERCVVTFTSWGNHSNGFAERLLSSRGISACYFISHGNHWWQTPEAPRAVNLLRDVLTTAGYRRLITYGASMGGYGAAMYAHSLGADTVVMIAPQFSIDPRKVPFERRWQREARLLEFHWDDMAAELSPALRYCALFDPGTDDRSHIELFSRQVPIEKIPLPYSGHTPGLVLRETGLLSNFVLDVIDAPLDAKALRRKVRRLRSGSPTYLSELSRAVQRRSISTAHTISRRVLDLAPDNVVHLLRALDLSLLENRLDEAHSLAKRAVHLAPGHPAPWRALSRIQVLQKRFDDAVDSGRKAVELRPGDADLQRVLLEALIRGQRLHESINVAETAIALAPQYAHTWERYALVLECMGQRFASRAVLMEAWRLGLRDPTVETRLRNLGGLQQCG